MVIFGRRSSIYVVITVLQLILLCDPCDIAGIFATKYQDLYSCVSYSSSDMSHIRQEITDSVAGAGYN